MPASRKKPQRAANGRFVPRTGSPQPSPRVGSPPEAQKASAQDEKSPSATSVGGSKLRGDGSSPRPPPGTATRKIEGIPSVRKIPRGLSPYALLYEAHAARKGVFKEVQAASPPSTVYF